MASGAGKAVGTLHRELLKRGIASSVAGRIEGGLASALVAERLPFSDRLTSGIIHRGNDHLNRFRYGKSNDLVFLERGSNFQALSAFREADILHIQWAHATSMGTRFWKQLASETRPIVWTLRDMWPFTGGCHFGGDCQKFETGCGDCPKIGRASETATAHQAEFKLKNLPQKATFVAISEQFAQKARRSHILRGHDIRVIPNSVEIQNHTPKMEKARTTLDLPPDEIVLSSGAINLASPRKGAKLLKLLVLHHNNRRAILWALFGGGFENMGFDNVMNCRSFGLIFNNEMLQNIYAASDLFIMPSLQESFGKTTIEAMASGTAVVAFRDTPAEEMIIHGENGWLVPHGNSDAFIQAVDNAIGLGRERLAEMGLAAQAHALEHFSLSNVVDRHLALYREKLGCI